jgi:transcription termination factor Rho
MAYYEKKEVSNNNTNNNNFESPIIDIADLKKKRIADLTTLAKSMGIMNLNELRKQELIMKIIEVQTTGITADMQIEGLIAGEGVLEVLPDGYGFLRSSDYNYLTIS